MFQSLCDVDMFLISLCDVLVGEQLFGDADKCIFM